MMGRTTGLRWAARTRPTIAGTIFMTRYRDGLMFNVLCCIRMHRHIAFILSLFRLPPCKTYPHHTPEQPLPVHDGFARPHVHRCVVGTVQCLDTDSSVIAHRCGSIIDTS